MSALSLGPVPSSLLGAIASRFSTMATSDRANAEGHGTVQLSADLQALMQCAKEAAQHSYSPYSGFKVGAALKLSNGAIVTGTNVENTSYGLTICAERTAMVQAVAQFGPGVRVTAAAITNLNDAPSPPCGACRQVLAEFIEPEATVVFPAADGMRAMRFSQLMPCAFEYNK